MKLFLLFYMCCSTMGFTIHVVIKRQLFTRIFADFLPQSTAMIPIFRFSKQMAAMWNYTSGFDVGPNCRHRHAIRHRPTNFIRIRR